MGLQNKVGNQCIALENKKTMGVFEWSNLTVKLTPGAETKFGMGRSLLGPKFVDPKQYLAIWNRKKKMPTHTAHCGSISSLKSETEF